MNSPEDKKFHDLPLSEAQEEDSLWIKNNIFIVVLREQVVFPNIQTRIGLAQKTLMKFYEHSKRYKTNAIGVMTLRCETTMDVYQIGTFCCVISRSPNAIIVEGASRFKVVRFNWGEPYCTAMIKLIDQQEDGNNNCAELKASITFVRQSIVSLLREKQLVQMGNQNLAAASLSELFHKECEKSGHDVSAKSASSLADLVGAGLGQLTTAERYQVLATVTLQKRLQLVLDFLRKARQAEQILQMICKL